LAGKKVGTVVVEQEENSGVGLVEGNPRWISQDRTVIHRNAQLFLYRLDGGTDVWVDSYHRW
jgi:hypothetical protein